MSSKIDSLIALIFETTSTNAILFVYLKLPNCESILYKSSFIFSILCRVTVKLTKINFFTNAHQPAVILRPYNDLFVLIGIDFIYAWMSVIACVISLKIPYSMYTLFISIRFQGQMYKGNYFVKVLRGQFELADVLVTNVTLT